MTTAYDIVEIAKAKNNIDSDNAFAMKFGFRRQNVNDWKFGRSEPKGINLLKLLKAADINIDEAIVLMTDTKKPLLEAGFANIGLLTTISGMSLLIMSPLPYNLIGASFLIAGNCILCKITHSS